MSSRLPVAVIDTTLLSRLVDTGLAALLPWAFAQVHVPSDVAYEIGKRPGRARRKLKNLFREEKGFYTDCREEDPVVRDLLKLDLDSDEAAVIAQADKIGAVAIIDEQAGFRRARRMSVRVLRTGSILCTLKELGAIDSVEVYLKRLQAHGFRITEAVAHEILRSAGEAVPGASPRKQR